MIRNATDAGRLDQKIDLQSLQATTNALNEPTGTWQTLAAGVPAMVQQTPGREFLKGDYHAEDKALFTIRYRDGVDSANRLVWAGKSWNILSVTGTRRTRFLQLQAISIDGAS